jgi:hypothetical protein
MVRPGAVYPDIQCDTKSLQMSGSGESPPPRLVPRSVPDPRKRFSNEACESRRVKPKGNPSHPGEPGKGKTGWVNASEPPLRLRNGWSSQSVAAATMLRPGTRPLYRSAKAYCFAAVRRGTQAAQYRRHPLPPRLSWCGTWQPRCGLAPGPVSRTIFGRTAQTRSGHRKAQEANATRRKARGIPNPVDRAPGPAPKGG